MSPRMTTNPKLSGGPDEGATLRAVAALTPQLPTPKRTEFADGTLMLAFRTFDDATVWASYLDASRTQFRQTRDDHVMISLFQGRWRGHDLVISSAEWACQAPAAAGAVA